MPVETFAWSCVECGEYNVARLQGPEAFREYYCGFCLRRVEAAPPLGAESPKAASVTAAPAGWDEILRPPSGSETGSRAPR